MSKQHDSNKYAFGSRFMESKGQPISYRGLTLVMVDRISIPIKQEVSVWYHLISVNSEWAQGISLKTDGWIAWEDRERIKNAWADIWERHMPKESVMTCYSRKSGILSVKNVWDQGRGGVESWCNGAAMWIEDIPGGKRYHCNDGHFDDDFDELVFDLKVIEP